MRPSSILQRATMLTLTAVPSSLLVTPAQAAPVTHQVGVGAALSVAIGGKSKAKAGFTVHAFHDATTLLTAGQFTGGGVFDPDAGDFIMERAALAEGVTIGPAVALRITKSAKPRLELMVRAGVTRAEQFSPGHVHHGTFRVQGGVGLIGTPTGLVGLDARLYNVRASVVRATSTQAAVATALELGLESGLIAPYGLGGSQVMDGRPLRDGAQARLPVMHTEGDLHAEAARWVKRGQEELGSVAAFQQLADELRSLRAPNDLIERCLHAADQEVVHALLCLGRAAELAGCAVHAVPLQRVPRHFSSRSHGRALLAQESLADGVLNEGAAALDAAGLARQAQHDVDGRIHRRIAAEESHHALLSADIVRWAS